MNTRMITKRPMTLSRIRKRFNDEIAASHKINSESQSKKRLVQRIVRRVVKNHMNNLKFDAL